MMHKPLRGKQARFVEEYLLDLNGTQAAIRAGYSAKTACATGSENLRKPHIAAAIAAAKRERSERTKLDADWLLERLGDEVEADLADLYDDDGELLPIKQWPPVWRKGLIAGVETQEIGEIKTVKIKVSDRVKRLELLGRHIEVGAFKESEVKLPPVIHLTVNRPKRGN